MGVEQRHAIAQRTQQQGQPGDPVGGDHHRGEHGVAGERRRIVPAGHHERNDQRHLDGRHRDREHQRTEWLTHPGRHHLGMVDRGQDSTG
ncbi:Uncharacterised protein [Mycobacterium tuberculosis]|nr:Uncharacterised protein [Mycobacterium tuberculosis]